MKKTLTLAMLLIFYSTSAFAITSSLGITINIKHAMGPEYYTISKKKYQRDFIVDAFGCSLFGSTYF